jgi:hypothetical protein
MNASGNAGLSLADGWDLSGISRTELWLGYLSLGGHPSQERMEAYAHGLIRPDCHEHNLIAQAINETFIEREESHPVGYQDLPPAR